LKHVRRFLSNPEEVHLNLVFMLFGALIDNQARTFLSKIQPPNQPLPDHPMNFHSEFVSAIASASDCKVTDVTQSAQWHQDNTQLEQLLRRQPHSKLLVSLNKAVKGLKIRFFGQELVHCASLLCRSTWSEPELDQVFFLLWCPSHVEADGDFFGQEVIRIY
jgi:hypothetical protein